MKPSSGRSAFVRILVCVVAIVVAVGYYGHVRAQSAGSSQTIIIPLRPVAPLSTVPVPPVFGMEGILADKTAAIQLGKALFWDMQAGSDDTQACASCHFNAGADSRAINQINPGQAGGDNNFEVGTAPNYHLKPGSADAGFGGFHDGDFPFHKLADVDQGLSLISDVNDVAGSQGVFASTKDSIVVTNPVPPGNNGGGDGGNGGGGGIGGDGSDLDGNGDGDAGFIRSPDKVSDPNRRVGGGASSGLNGAGGQGVTTEVRRNGTVPVTNSVEVTTSIADPVFSFPDPAKAGKRINTRKVTGRNTPSAVNAVFNFRNFWDGRAQNTCNGANPFGARDGQAHLMVTDETGEELGPALVNMKNSALCSQALGPILSSVEMSADDRNFHQVGKKLLLRTPLAHQFVDPTDSVLGALSNAPGKGLNTSYAALIRQAFHPDWWKFQQNLCLDAAGNIVAKANPAQFDACPSGTTGYSQMEYNFSLFWGVAIQMYESTLIADQTPFDKYLEQQKVYTLIGDNESNSYTIQLDPGVDPYTISVIGLNPQLDFSDQDVFGFDDGFGHFTGAGIDGTVNYATGSIVLNFEDPPVSTIPIKISYSVGPTPLTPAQLHGLTLFQGKARCIVCHGGPELSNAAVDTVAPNPLERMVMADLSVKVYDTGYYHIGVRPGAEDAGLAGADPVAGQPLSNGEFQRQRVCNDPSLVMMIPGRPGEGITQAPLNCGDDIARTGFFKAPQLRNIALTAPYFHNGSELTLEQVVEFYNRGGDFQTVSEIHIMDGDIEPLGLTLQEKKDLVDFLRNGLTDPRTVAQAAPFDHPQFFTPNGHPADGAYPVKNDPDHPGQATTQLMEIPAVGRDGGKPLPTFLENLLKNQHN
jgi:cytochrome c peroxidase